MRAVIGDIVGETDGNTNVSFLENKNSTSTTCTRGAKWEFKSLNLEGYQWGDWGYWNKTYIDNDWIPGSKGSGKHNKFWELLFWSLIF